MHDQPLAAAVGVDDEGDHYIVCVCVQLRWQVGHLSTRDYASPIVGHL